MNLLLLLVSGIFVHNFILSRFLGICPFLGVSKQIETAFGMGIAVTFVMGLASAITYVVQYTILVPYGLEYLQTIAFILVIATLVQLVEMVIKKTSPTLYEALGVYLPLITTNCAVLGVALLNIQYGYNFIESVVFGIAGLSALCSRSCCSRGSANATNFPRFRKRSTASRSRSSRPA